MPSPIKLDLNVEIDILTAGSAAEVVNVLLEFLLYQRNQIPFVYKTFKYYIAKWQDDENKKLQSNDDEVPPAPSNFNLERQRERATQTKQSISAMRELITTTFERNEIKCLRFLFGSTAHTPLEAYTIHIPTTEVLRTHSYVHHPLPQPCLNQTLINLITSKELYTLFSKNLSPTNVFLEFEMIDDGKINDTGTETHIFPKDFCELPASCKDVHLNLVLTKPMTSCDSTTSQCCKELQIYQDLLHFSLTSDNSPKTAHKTDEKLCVSLPTAWWEAEIFVRGFKGKPLKSGDIWTM